MCELLKALPEWEAIKLSRCHYRSCGKDPEACCVSDLLREEAVVRSGRAENYAVGKDTPRRQFAEWHARATVAMSLEDLPVFTTTDFSDLVRRIQQLSDML